MQRGRIRGATIQCVTIPKETIWELEPHTRVKHLILRSYLSAWFPILGPYHPRVDYIDGFSGPGRYKGGEEGSPIIALKAAQASLNRLPPEVHFFFIENEKDRLEHLSTELSALTLGPQLENHLLGGSFDEEIVPVMEELAVHKDRPVFVFIDPFGFAHMPFSVVRSFLEHEHGEVLVTFMADAMNRFLTHPDEAIGGHIVETFGTEEVLALAKSPDRGVPALRDLYGNQLRGVARFVRHFEMRDSDDRVIYYLFFATNHPLGHVKMKEAMWQLDPGGEFRFSDATDPAQLVMFAADIEGPLSQLLRARFDGASATAGEIRTFVEDETAYLKRQMSDALKKMERVGEVAVSEYKVGGQKRKAGTYPDDAVLRFQTPPAATESGASESEQTAFDW